MCLCCDVFTGKGNCSPRALHSVNAVNWLLICDEKHSNLAQMRKNGFGGEFGSIPLLSCEIIRLRLSFI